LGIKLNQWACVSKFSSGAYVRFYATSTKRKWSKSDIETLQEWKRVTDEVFGPIVMDRKGISEQSKGTIMKSSQSNRIAAAVAYTKPTEVQIKDVNFMTVKTGLLHNEKLTETIELGINSGKFADNDLLDSSNYSEMKLLSSAMRATGKQGAFSRIAGRSADGLSNALEVNHSLYSFNVENTSQRVSFLDSDDTTDYQWVDRSSEVTGNAKATWEMNGVNLFHVEKAASSETESLYVKSQQEIYSVAGLESAQPTSGVNTVQSAALEHGDCKNSVVKNDTVILVADKNSNKSAVFNDSFIMSFPLIIPDSKKEVPASSPKNAPGRLPSVTKILQATQSPESRMVLERWEKQMIAELGEAGFAQYRAGWTYHFRLFN
jgi:hypothetical protein